MVGDLRKRRWRDEQHVSRDENKSEESQERRPLPILLWLAAVYGLVVMKHVEDREGGGHWRRLERDFRHVYGASGEVATVGHRRVCLTKERGG